MTDTDRAAFKAWLASKHHSVMSDILLAYLEEAWSDAIAHARAQPQPLGPRLWLWKNGDHFLAFDNLYPCFTPGGDPMTLGEPIGYAIFKPSSDRGAQLPCAVGAQPQGERVIVGRRKPDGWSDKYAWTETVVDGKTNYEYAWATIERIP